MKGMAIAGNVIAVALLLPLVLFFKIALTVPTFSHWGGLMVWTLLLGSAAGAVWKLSR